MLCYIMLCYIMLLYIMLCYVIICIFLLCYLIIILPICHSEPVTATYRLARLPTDIATFTPFAKMPQSRDTLHFTLLESVTAALDLAYIIKIISI